MNYQGGFETFREATRYMFEAPSLYDVLFIILGFSFAILFLIVLPYVWSRYKAKIHLKEEFIKVGKSFDLTDSEISLLWKGARLLKEPLKVFQNKAAFEKCIGKLVREGDAQTEVISQIRRKLSFEKIPWFLPLTTTRDIELYQTGFITYGNNAYSSAVWDKDEQELHIALLDSLTEIPKQGDKVKFSFLREDDGRYYFQAEVLRVYKDGIKTVLVLPHTEALSRIQLRESLRWKVKIPANVSIFHEGFEYTVEGVIEDISPKGVKVCLPGIVEVRVEDRLLVSFELKNISIEALGTVKHIRIISNKTCLGLNFLGLSSDMEDYIRRFIIEQQREALKLYKLGETKGDSSS